MLQYEVRAVTVAVTVSAMWVASAVAIWTSVCQPSDVLGYAVAGTLIVCCFV
jgi:hypothetical protein